MSTYYGRGDRKHGLSGYDRMVIARATSANPGPEAHLKAREPFCAECRTPTLLERRQRVRVLQDPVMRRWMQSALDKVQERI